MSNYPYQIRSREQYDLAYKKSVEDPEGFWAGVAGNFQWHRRWDKVLDWNFTEPRVRWFDVLSRTNLGEPSFVTCQSSHLPSPPTFMT